MDAERARCGKCGAAVTPHQDLIFPADGGVEHLDCTAVRKPLARISGEPTALPCLACDEPLAPGDQVTMIGHDVFHTRCLERLRVIGGGSGPSTRRLARPIIEDPFARMELIMACQTTRLDAADARASSRHMRGVTRAGKVRRTACCDR
jgi:hypothetical protein